MPQYRARLRPIVARIPMAALVAVMIIVSVGTFDWHSIRPSTLKSDAAERDRGDGHHGGGDRADETSPSASGWGC
jgi:hypothetical protein